MNYKGWDKRKTNRGRGRSNWNWRGRGHNRMPMPNQFLQNHAWPNSPMNYNNYHVPHHELNPYYYNSRHPKPFHTPFHGISNPLAKPPSPLPGSEEYTQNKIQQTSDLIKKQLNIDSETCSPDNLSIPSNITLSECLNNNIQSELTESETNKESTNLSTENKRGGRKRSKTAEIIDVQEIHDKIIKHISNLSYSKKMNLVNQSTSGYDIAIQEVQKQKRLELSRALRDMSKREIQSSDDGEVINAIIPDIGIKIEDLPNDIIAELSNCLNISLDHQLNTLVDPELCFKQAEEILNVNFEHNDNFKLFHSNVIIDNAVNNSLNKDNNDTKNTLSEEITFNYNLLNKESDRESICNPIIQNEDYNCHESACVRNYNQDDENDNSKDDYSKDIEFNNFCFENFDVNKSYLAPFNSRDLPSPNFVTITSVFELPKISVRKDILQDGNVNENTMIENSESVSDHTTVHQVNENNNRSKEFPENSSNLLQANTDMDCESTNMCNLNTDICLNDGNISSMNSKTDLPDILQSTANLATSQDSQVCNNILQPLEYCAQKRWKSPGEKKMMADIQLKSNIIINPCHSLTSFSNVLLPKCESPTKQGSTTPPKDTHQDEINVETVNNISTQIEANTSPIELEEKSSLNNDTKLTQKKINESKNITGESNLTESTSKTALEPTSTETKTSYRTLKHQNTKHKKTKLSDSKTENELLNKSDTSNDNYSENNLLAKNEDACSKVPDNLDVKNKGENVDLHRDHFKEHRKVKTAAEKKETTPITKSTYNIQTIVNEDLTTEDVQMRSEIPLRTTKNSSTQTTVDKLNIETLTVKTCVKDVNTQTIQENESGLLIPKETEKNVAIVLKSVKDMYIQTDIDSSLILENKNQLKQYKDVEVQATKFLSTTSMQTLVPLEKYDNQTNYLDYIIKLRDIDAKIEQLIEIKREIYKNVESKYNISSTTQTSTNEPINTNLLVEPSTEKHNICHTNEVTQQINTFSKSEATTTTMLTKKHKKLDSDNEFEETMHNPKRKKRHKNSKKAAFNSLNKHNDVYNTSSVITTNNPKINIEEVDDVRKPLSIKISLKNLIQSPSKREFEEAKKPQEENTPKQTTNKKKFLQESYIIESHEGSGQILSIKDSPQKPDSCEKEVELDNTSTTHRLSHPTSENSTGTFHKERKYTKVNRSKKINTNKHNINLNNLKLSDSDYERLFNRTCHVIIERYTIEKLEHLRKNLQEIKSHLKTTSIERTSHVGCGDNDKLISLNDFDSVDKTNFEFRNFTGAALYVTVVQEMLLASTDNGYLYFFDINTGDAIDSIKISEKPVTSIHVVTTSDGCNVFLGCLMGVLTILNFVTKEILNTVQCEDGIQCLEKEWEYIFMGSHKGHVMRYNLKKNKLEQSLKIYDSNVLAIKATLEGARRVLLVASRNTRITVRDAMSGLLMRTLDSTFNPTVYTILLENSTIYCGTSQHDILVYTFQDGQLCHKYEAANSKGIVCLKVAGDLLFAGCYNGNIYVYSISSKKYLGQITGPGGMLLSMDVYKNKIIVGTKTNKLKSLKIPHFFLNQAKNMQGA